jgi:phosphoserine phosphatase RsbU/P
MRSDDLVVDVSQDWVLACDVQRRFMGNLPRISSPVDYSARCRQVRALGGDCYDFIPLADDRFALVVGDASGKGLAAALMMANVQSSLRAAALFAGNDLATLFKIVNHLAYTSSLANRYATVFYAVFDPATGTLRYINAGHHAPMVLGRNGSIDWLDRGGAPIAMFPDSNYQEGHAKVEHGDLVIAFSDGVIEATNHSGEEWGVDGLFEAASTAAKTAGDADELVNRIFHAMDDFSDRNQADDATLAIVRVL